MNDEVIRDSIKMVEIGEIANKINISDIDMYGRYKAKINGCSSSKNGKLILVTSINPTPLGEGKTTVSIGLLDGLCKLGKNAIAALREPSLGPVFGIKGGATGGGYAQMVPAEDINLHFTGDFHAITTANNLIASAIDNHIYFGNKLGIKRVLFNRCIDMNDRALRNVSLKDRVDHFDITAASEIASIFVLSSDIDDMKRRIDNITIGLNEDDERIYLRELNVTNAVMAILKDAVKPNLVQSLEANPIILHGGPFANISCGCNSIIATKMGLSTADYVVTEAGFGADLGGLKFMDIIPRISDLKPDCVVVVATIKALKYHGDGELVKGINNLGIHIENIKKNTNNIVVCLNKYDSDLVEEVEYVKDYVNNYDCFFEVIDSYQNGSKGALDIANRVVYVCNRENDFKLLYDDDLSIRNKIEFISKNIYRAGDISYTKEATSQLEEIERLGMNAPICVAKTQYSISDNAKMLELIDGYTINITNVKYLTGSNLIVVYMGNIMTMPGLSKNPNYENIRVVDDRVVGII